MRTCEKCKADNPWGPRCVRCSLSEGVPIEWPVLGTSPTLSQQCRAVRNSVVQRQRRRRCSRLARCRCMPAGASCRFARARRDCRPASRAPRRPRPERGSRSRCRAAAPRRRNARARRSAPALVTTDINAVTASGAPSYTSGVHTWNGTELSLNAMPTKNSPLPSSKSRLVSYGERRERDRTARAEQQRHAEEQKARCHR